MAGIERGGTMAEDIQALNQKIDHLTREVVAVTSRFKAWDELKEDLVLFSNDAFKEVINFLGEVDFHLRGQDFLFLIKKLLRNVNNLAKMMNQLESLMELKEDLTPLAKEIFNDLVDRLDKLEKDGLFASVNALLGVLNKLQHSFSPRDIAGMGDGLIRLLKVINRFSRPENLDKLERMADTIESYDFGREEKVSLFKLLKKARQPEVLRGLNHALNLVALMGQDKKKQGGKNGTT